MSIPPGPRHGGPRQVDPRQQRPPEQWRQPERLAAAPSAEGTAREAGWVFALRVTAYVLTSLASLVFLVLVIYAYVKVGQLQDALSSNPLFGGNSSYSSPAVPSQQDVCLTNPDAPECTAGLD